MKLIIYQFRKAAEEDIEYVKHYNLGWFSSGEWDITTQPFGGTNQIIKQHEDNNIY